VSGPIRITSSVRCRLGEGPLWHPAIGALHVVDIPNGCVYILSAALTTIDVLQLGRPTTALALQADGSLLSFHDGCAISRISTWYESTLILDSLPEETGGIFNDVIADSAGRVLCGTQPVCGRLGRLYCIDPDLSWRVLLNDVCEPNGLGFSPDGRTLYFADSVAQTIWQFSYDQRNGTISRRSALFRTCGDQLPDGLTVDSDGYVWAAIWNGGCIIRIDPAGHLVQTVELPAQRTTSVVFGGASLDILYVTTAARETHPNVNDIDRYDGAVFGFPGIGRGRDQFPSRLGL
jgi:sugar lactone lactonase YvrE